MTTPTTTWTLNPLFESVKNEPELRAWLMRAYFSPTKHSGEPYFKPDVSKENILEYISCAKTFPQTPHSIVTVWGVLPSLREGLKNIPTSRDGEKLACDDQEKAGVYTKGEKTLAEIGASIGGVSAAMANKISDSAVLKITTMVQALSSTDKRLAKDTSEKIENAILNTAEIFADAIQKTNTAQDFLGAISETEILSTQDLLVADALELECLEELICWSREGATQAELEDVFIEDLKKMVNIFNLAQLAVSRQVYPFGKRGRPKASGK